MWAWNWSTAKTKEPTPIASVDHVSSTARPVTRRVWRQGSASAKPPPPTALEASAKIDA